MGNLEEVSFDKIESDIQGENISGIDSSWFKDSDLNASKDEEKTDIVASIDNESFAEELSRQFEDFSKTVTDQGDDSISDDSSEVKKDENHIETPYDFNVNLVQRANNASMFYNNQPITNEEQSRTTIDDYIAKRQIIADDELNSALNQFSSLNRVEFENDEQYDNIRHIVQESIIEFIKNINQLHNAFYADKDLMSRTATLRYKKETVLQIIASLMVHYEISEEFLTDRLPNSRPVRKDIDTLVLYVENIKRQNRTM